MTLTIDRERFLEEGWLVVPDVVPPEMCRRVIDAIIDYADIDLDDPAGWYTETREGHGILPLHHEQALWDIRQHPPVYDIFRQLYEEDALWVTMDRVSWKPPASEQTRAWKQAAVHWDCDPWNEEVLGIQGLVYLVDTEPDQGAFCCVPSIYRNLDVWREQHRDDDDRRRPDVSESDLMPVGAKAGSLVLWHRLMPHTSSLNRSAQHRFVQYVAMLPAGNEAQRRQQVKDYEEKMPPAWAIRQQVPGQQMPEPGEPAQLTELGRKLVGLDRW
ncbi:MAG: phytanoyl-CoA dioxygenase family protein [Pseudomonadales bacterium]|nr:phytanoyl-CoA dioxygenase family protein [Pseudomonadales bacterium]